MVERIRFTPAAVAGIEHRGVGTDEYRDEADGNLILRVGARTKVWCYFGRPAPGKRPTRRRLGDASMMSPAQARRACRQMAAGLLKGDDPVERRRAEAGTPTLAVLHAAWLKLYAEPRKRTASRDRWLFDKYFAPLARKRVDLIGPADVTRWYEGLAAESGPYTANRCLSLLRAMYRRAPSLVNLGVKLEDPAAGIERHDEHARERFIEGDELRRLFAAASKEPEWFQDLVALAVLSGVRRRNLFEARWEQFDLTRSVWTIPRESAKSGKPLRIHLVGPAVDILLRRQDAATTPWVFPSPQSPGKPLVEPRDRWERVLRRAKLHDVRWHDLRRSFGAALTRAGVPMVAIGAALGHSPGSHATAVYARLADDTVAEAVTNGTASLVQALPVERVAREITAYGLRGESAASRGTGREISGRSSGSSRRRRPR